MRGVASTADTLAFRLASCWDILVISGMSSWAEQEQGGWESFKLQGERGESQGGKEADSTRGAGPSGRGWPTCPALP